MIPYTTWKETFKTQAREIYQQLQQTYPNEQLTFRIATCQRDCLDILLYEGKVVIQQSILSTHTNLLLRKHKLQTLNDILTIIAGRRIVIITETRTPEKICEQDVTAHERYRKPVAAWREQKKFGRKARIFTT